jgi:riboflavin synthase
MFTGIVEERGTATDVGMRLTVECRKVLEDSDVGSSLAVNGVCLTVVARDDERLTFDLSPETVKRTTLAELAPGDPVNLERPVTLSTRMGGHLVQGHVDGMGIVMGVAETLNGRTMEIDLSPDLARYVVEKGSICVDGVSLTVSSIDDGRFAVSLVPFTLEATNLGSKQRGDPVNLEVDMIAKYVERLMRETR